MDQPLYTVIAPDGTEHHFILPGNQPLSRLMPLIVQQLELPHPFYRLINVLTGEPIAPGQMLGEAFPNGTGTIEVIAWGEFASDEPDTSY